MAPATVLVTRRDFPEDGIKLLQMKYNIEIWNGPDGMPRNEFLKMVKDKDALYCTAKNKIDNELLDNAGPNLKVIGTYSVGYDHIDLEACKKRGIKVGYTPDVLTDACAELTIALLLATSRRLFEAAPYVIKSDWGWTPLWMCGKSLAGCIVGIVGMGRIGFGVAERLKAFKVKKIVYSGNRKKPEADGLGAEFVPFDDLVRQSDFVICCAALTPTSKHLFNLEAFGKMKIDSIFVNTSRGGLVNHDDLYTALTTGLIQAAGLDVTEPEPLPLDHKLTKLKNCVLLPHISSATVETRKAMSVLTAQNIIAGLEGKPLPAPL